MMLSCISRDSCPLAARTVIIPCTCARGKVIGRVVVIVIVVIVIVVHKKLSDLEI